MIVGWVSCAACFFDLAQSLIWADHQWEEEEQKALTSTVGPTVYLSPQSQVPVFQK